MKIESYIDKRDIKDLYYLYQKGTDQIIIIVSTLFYITTIYSILLSDFLVALTSILIFIFAIITITYIYNNIFSYISVLLLGKNIDNLCGKTLTIIDDNGVKAQTPHILLENGWKDIKKMKAYSNGFILITKRRNLYGFYKRNFNSNEEYNQCKQLVQNYLSK